MNIKIQNPFFHSLRLGLLLLIFSTGTIQAQWVWCGLSSIHTLSKIGGHLLVGSDNGAAQSSDSGKTWIYPRKGLEGQPVLALTVSGSNIFAGTRTGVFLSTDTGANWKSISSGLTPDSAVMGILVDGNDIFAGTPTGVYRSDTTGANWTAVNNGLPPKTSVSALATLGSRIFIGTMKGEIFLSENKGLDWKSVGARLSLNSVHDLVVSGNKLFVVFAQAVYLSINSGTTWNSASSGLSSEIYRLTVNGATLFAATDHGVYFSGNDGVSWEPFNTGLVNLDVRTVLVHGTNVYLGSMSGLWRRPLSQLPAALLPGAGSKRELGFSSGLSSMLRPGARIKFSIGRPGRVDLDFEDSRGRKITTLVHANLSAGEHEVVFTGSGMAAGAYVLMLRSRESIRRRMFIYGK